MNVQVGYAVLWNPASYLKYFDVTLLKIIWFYLYDAYEDSRVQGTIWVQTQAQVSYVQDKCSICCTLFLWP